eukprot:TRINITY_DN66166_c5_g8_i1.p1 TRINITY_DN66166_c5_g8~~TRINITY_DN66166_c5_g8_i1.p1  ORF type:complete len:296 (-),score=152.14 TRINITY_DN66166_c5_g8_i1:855-1664(-)
MQSQQQKESKDESEEYHATVDKPVATPPLPMRPPQPSESRASPVQSAAVHGTVVLSGKGSQSSQPKRNSSSKKRRGSFKSSSSKKGKRSSRAVVAESADVASVLIVEDAKPVQKIMMRMMRILGVYAELAENGRVAVDKCTERLQSNGERRMFDLIFMDVNMPEMNGFEATARLRAMNIHVPIVAVTGNALEDDHRTLMETGVDAILSKPTTRTDLSLALQRFLPVARMPEKLRSKMAATVEATPNVRLRAFMFDPSNPNRDNFSTTYM